MLRRDSGSPPCATVAGPKYLATPFRMLAAGLRCLGRVLEANVRLGRGRSRACKAFRGQSVLIVEAPVSEPALKLAADRLAAILAVHGSKVTRRVADPGTDFHAALIGSDVTDVAFFLTPRRFCAACLRISERRADLCLIGGFDRAGSRFSPWWRAAVDLSDEIWVSEPAVRDAIEADLPSAAAKICVISDLFRFENAPVRFDLRRPG